ncbi:hypothetical protein JVT61DRAFT_1803 [Boletus reticuloceps]|uniref:Uncharacterized protein n=1 Tax=Boletus reticuloceps TaxID=495285 RepID=A0A8I2YPH4_9AGAM|nr:hypothetical protein JVT61DRAFT_1803 [Boletus reticuloceps]
MTSSPSQNQSSNPTNTSSNNITPPSIASIVVTPTPSASISGGSGSASTPTSLFTTPVHTQGSPAKAQQWLAAYTLLSPDSKARAAKAFDAIKPADAAPTIVFSTNKEIKMSLTLDSTYGLGIHPTINDLAKAGQYLPLILFTDDNQVPPSRRSYAQKNQVHHRWNHSSPPQSLRLPSRRLPQCIHLA